MKLLKIILTIFSLFGGLRVSGQTDTIDCIINFDTVLNRQIHIVVDIMPEFPGGTDSLLAFIMGNLKYPNEGGCFEGTVYISLIVEPDGELSNITLIRGIYEPADKEVLTVIRKLPNWIPGNCHGHKVAVKIVLPIELRLK